jgi:hypothetical protein
MAWPSLRWPKRSISSAPELRDIYVKTPIAPPSPNKINVFRVQPGAPNDASEPFRRKFVAFARKMRHGYDTPFHPNSPAPNAISQNQSVLN